jgi:hypothetical protein
VFSFSAHNFLLTSCRDFLEPLSGSEIVVDSIPGHFYFYVSQTASGSIHFVTDFFFLLFSMVHSRKSLAAWLDPVDYEHPVRPAMADRSTDPFRFDQACENLAARTPRTVSFFSAHGAAGVTPAVPSTSAECEREPRSRRLVERTQCAPHDT